MRKVALLVAMTTAVAVMAYCAAVPARWTGMVAAAFAGMGIVGVIWKYVPVSTGQVLLFALLFRLFLFLLPPGLSDDAYRYIWDGHLQVEGINPYTYRPEDPQLAEYQDEPIYAKLNSAEFYSVYPPASQLVFRMGGYFYEYGWMTSYYVIKGVFLLLEVAGIFILARMVPSRSLLLYAWQPLVLLEVAGQGHTEAAMVFFLIATVWGVQEQRPTWAAAALAGAGWVKLYPFVFFPFLWRRFGWRAVWPAGLAAAAFAAPYVGLEAFRHMVVPLELYVRYFEFNAGLYLGVKRIFLEITGADWSKQLGPFFQYLFLSSLPVIYLLDTKEKWPFDTSLRVTMGMFFLLATTVHPWYLLGILALVPFSRRPAWHWHVLSLGGIGTYLFYQGGPYTLFVAMGWGGWALLGGAAHADEVLQWIQRLRARRKRQMVAPYLPEGPLRVLDLGAGEGYVGEALQRSRQAEVVLADVLPLNRTDLPFFQYDGTTLPFDDKSFDVTLLVFVLHHCRDPDRVLQEAFRVSRKRVIVVESVYESARGKQLLRALDRIANRVRSRGLMNAQEEHLHFRKAAEWCRLIEEQGGKVVGGARHGHLVHRQAVLAARVDSTSQDL